jgi:hypothetical protein
MKTMKHHRFSAAILLLAVLIASLGACAPKATEPVPTETATNTETPTDTVTPTEEPTQTPWIITVLPEATATVETETQGFFFLSLPDGGYYHLFAYP